MTFLISMLFIAAIAFSIITISGSFASSWSRIVEVIEFENSQGIASPKIRIGEAKYYRASQNKTVGQDDVVIAFPRQFNSTTSVENILLPEAA